MKQDVSRNVSGIDTGALMVLRSAKSEEFIPISKPQDETICCAGLNCTNAELVMSDDIPKLAAHAGNIC